MKIKNKIQLIFFIICLTTVARSQSQQCQNPNYIIPYDPIDDAFDTTINAIRGQAQLINLIQNPNQTAFKDYLLSLSPYAAPLFAMAGLTLAIFIATIIQVICFNSCGKQCCGNELSSTTYNICCFRTIVAFFIIICFLVGCLSIAALIVTSDFQKASDYTSCNTQNIIYQTYNGNNANVNTWSGVNNFLQSINAFSVNIQNNVPFLATYFSSSNPSYIQITDNSASSSYNASQIFNCMNANIPINCPFPSVSSCTGSYQAQFNQQFCNTTFNGSAANLIANQQSKNSTTWFNNTQEIATVLSSTNLSPQNVNNLVYSITNFSTSVSDFETSIQSGFSQIDSVYNKIQIAFYVFYSFILGISLFATVSLCMVYFCFAYKCRCFMYFFWYMFFLLALLLFIDSGFFFGASIFIQDSCIAYPYFFKNQTNFQSLNFGSTQLQGAFKTCFFSTSAKPPSFFTGFPNTQLLNTFGSLFNQYQKALPSSSFSSVVTTIENTLTNYRANPNTVIIQNVPSSSQPATALSQMNTFANSSLPTTTQSCKLTKDYITFDVVNCGNYLTYQVVGINEVGSNQCVVLYSSNINTFVTGRVNQFNSRSCNADGTTYQDRINALISYSQSINAIVSQLAPISQQNIPLQDYQQAYFQYYSNVLNFYNSDVQAIFNGFFIPYNTLMQGSSCGFVTASMNGIVNISCNQLQPYINLLSALNITSSAFVFILFVLSYFLTTRLEFYEYLEGNFANFGAKTYKTSQLPNAIELDSTGRNIQLLQVNKSQL